MYMYSASDPSSTKLRIPTQTKVSEAVSGLEVGEVTHVSPLTEDGTYEVTISITDPAMAERIEKGHLRAIGGQA